MKNLEKYCEKLIVNCSIQHNEGPAGVGLLGRDEVGDNMFLGTVGN